MSDRIRLGLELHPVRRGPKPRLHYVRSCSYECDARLHSVGHDPGSDGERVEVADLSPMEPCTVCASPTERMRLVHKAPK